jgi:SAM-dependent methyltransferase
MPTLLAYFDPGAGSLLLQAHRGIDFQPLLRSELEGLPAERMVRWFSLGDLFRPGVLTHVWLHSWLRQAVDQPAGETQRSLARSGLSTEHVLRNLAGLTRLVSQLRWTPPRTTWTGYDESLPHVAADRAAKQQFVRQVCGQRPRRLVWDLGCNTGDYSRIAAAFADTVIAMDQDHGCVERLYRRLVTDGPGNILPLRIDLASPSPALGWRGRERLRLESRGQPDLVLCLGLIHHLVIAGNVPLDDVVDWLAELGGEVILEFPDKSDAQVQSLLSGKPDQYDDYCWEELQAQLELRFQLADCVTLPSGSRRLLHAVPLT